MCPLVIILVAYYFLLGKDVGAFSMNFPRNW